jgi:hypothetical protein
VGHAFAAHRKKRPPGAGKLLHIASVTTTLPDGEIIDQLDDFIIDNAVMWFKPPTGAQPPVPPMNKG